MTRIRHAHGYTLIELLVAIALAGLVAALGAVVLRATIDFHGRAVRRMADSEHLKSADRLLLREWSRRTEQDLVATPRQIEFRSDRLYGIGVDGAGKVRYVCIENDTGEFSLERQVLAPGEPTRQPGVTSIAPTSPGWRVTRSDVLVPQLVACGFSYLRTREARSGTGVERTGEWAAEPAIGQPPPRLLRLRLATARGEIAPLVYQVDG